MSREFFFLLSCTLRKTKILSLYGMRNRIANCSNPYQGAFPRVLVVCSAGLLRSPTVAWILSNPPYNCNTRAVGSNKDFALLAADEVHVAWAEHLVFVNEDNQLELEFRIEGFASMIAKGKKQVWNLDLPDEYSFRDPELIKIAQERIVSCGLHAALLSKT